MEKGQLAWWRKRKPDKLTVKVLSGTAALGVLLVVFATDIDDILFPTDPLGQTLTNLSVLFVVVLPVFYLAVHKPVLRLLEERRQSVETLKLRLREAGALNAISEVAARELDLERVLSRVMDVVLSVLEADGGWLLLLPSRPASAPRVLVSQGVPAALGSPETADFCLDCSPSCGGILDKLPPGEITLINECRNLPREVLLQAGFGGYVGVLLPVGRHVRAVLNLLWRAPRTLADVDQAFLRSVARQIGIEAESAALYAAEQGAREKADAISSVTLALNQTLELDAVLRTLFDHLRRLVPFDRARAILQEGESRLDAKAVFSSFESHESARTARSRYEVTRDPLVSEVLETRRSVCVSRATRQGAPNGAHGADEGHSWLGVPLLVEGRAIGVVTLTKEAPNFYGEEHLRMAEALAAPASVAIANARLFGEVLSARERLEKLSRKLVEVQESERRHLARELHDEIGQSLTAILYRLEAAKGVADTKSRAVLGEASEIADRAIQAVRDLSLDLRPSLLDEAGLADTLRWYIDRQVQSESLEVGLSVFPEAASLPLDVRTACFRVAQEALTNVIRHAQAHHARVELLRSKGGIELAVWDDGRGFDVDEARHRARKGESLGILGIEERVELLGGEVVFNSSPGRGTTVRATLPLPGGADLDAGP